MKNNLDKSKEISKLQEEKQAFEKQVFYWKGEIMTNTNKVYIAKCLATISRYENSIEQIERQIIELQTHIEHRNIF